MTKEMYSIFPKGSDLEELFDIDDSLVAGRSSFIDLVSPRGKAYRLDFVSNTLDRRVFDKHLVSLAIEKGARLEQNVSLLSLKDGVARTTRGEIRAKVIVGCDGPNSLVAREAGAGRPTLRYPAVTCRAKGDFGDAVKMFFGSVAPGGYAWIIPKYGGANIGLGFDNRADRGPPSIALRGFVDRLGCEVSDISLGFVPMSGPVPTTVVGRTLLVGDAAGHTMASNGGGIPTAMIAGRIAGRTIKDHLTSGAALKSYEDRWRHIMDAPLRNSVRIRRLADVAFSRDTLLGMAMAVLGRRGLDRAIRCKRLIL